MDLGGMLADANLLALLCLGFGLVLMLIEVFLPGFGVSGMFGSFLLVIGISLTARTLFEGLLLVIILLAIIGINLLIVYRSATKGKLRKSLVLAESLSKEDGFSSTEDLSAFLGQDGISCTVLRPAGIADFHGVKLDVVSEGEFIAPHTKVKVIKVVGRRVIVRKLPES